MEPLAHNPFINLFRKMTPSLRTDDEHPLRMRDLKLFEEYFSKVDVQYFHLAALCLVPLKDSAIRKFDFMGGDSECKDRWTRNRDSRSELECFAPV